MSMSGQQQITLIRINNPFDPKDHIREDVAWHEPAPLIRLAPVGQTECVYSVNGKVIEPEQYATTFVSPGDCVVSCPILRGGGDSKNVLRIVALVAIAVFAPYAAGLYFAAGTVGFAATAAGIAIAGSLIVNSILPPPTPNIDVGGSGGSVTEASYGADGPKNVSREGGIVPVVYGNYRMGGNLISSRTEQVDADQYLYLLFALSEGPVASINDILINDTAISKFKNAEAQVRLGHNDQAPIDWFSDNEVLVPKGVKLAHDSWVYHTTSSEVDKLKVNLLSPTGIGRISKDSGNTMSHSVDVEAQYRLLGTEEWRPFLSNNDFVIVKRPVAPHEVVEVIHKHVAYHESRTEYVGKNDHPVTKLYKLRVPKVSYTKTIVLKSFKFTDTDEIITDPEVIAQVRKLIRDDTVKKIRAAYKKSGGNENGGSERSRAERDYGGGAGDLGSSDSDNHRGDNGGVNV